MWQTARKLVNVYLHADGAKYVADVQAKGIRKAMADRAEHGKEDAPNYK